MTPAADSGAGAGVVPGPTRRCAMQAMLMAAAMPLGAGAAQPPGLEAPNIVQISPQLVTSGQPTAASLRRLKDMGFGAVIYLAPETVPDAVPGESAILQAQGLGYVNIPVPFNRPTGEDVAAFEAALARFEGRKVLVHCQVNMRASSMVFLHRVVVGRERPEAAYDAVSQVWSPEGPWKALIESQLRQVGISFELY